MSTPKSSGTGILYSKLPSGAQLKISMILTVQTLALGAGFLQSNFVLLGVLKPLVRVYLVFLSSILPIRHGLPDAS